MESVKQKIPYFTKNIIPQLKSELLNLNYGEIVLIHENKITFVTDYDKYNGQEHINKYNVVNDNIQINEPYNDELFFSYYDNNEKNIYHGGFERSEVMYLNFTIDNNTINCNCSRIEVDPKSIMYDQLTSGCMKFQKINDIFVYLSGSCQDRYGDCYSISEETIIEVLNIISKYWNIQ
jgi:hypothetical protein